VAGPVAASRKHCFDGCRRASKYGLHRTIIPIANPACEATGFSFAADPGTITDTLDPAVDDGSDGRHANSMMTESTATLSPFLA
jgi:hypothetical protein